LKSWMGPFLVIGRFSFDPHWAQSRPLAAHHTNNSGPILDDRQPFSSAILGPFMVVVTDVLLAL
jgi:hypothetical protein